MLVFVDSVRHGSTIVDPFGDDYSKYEGAYIIIPNKGEAARATDIDIENNGKDSEIGKFLSKEGGEYKVYINGYASASATEEYNMDLSKSRISSAETLLNTFNSKLNFISKPFGETQAAAPEGADADNEQSVIDRRVDISIEYFPQVVLLILIGFILRFNHRYNF